MAPHKVLYTAFPPFAAVNHSIHIIWQFKIYGEAAAASVTNIFKPEFKSRPLYLFGM